MLHFAAVPWVLWTWTPARGFRTWSSGQSILARFWSKLRQGRLEDGTAGVRPVILYGDARFSASGRGRHSAPTTTMRGVCIRVCSEAWVRNADEHRSTKCCSSCGRVMDTVYAPTPPRIYRRAAARELNALPAGFTRPPAKPIPFWTKVRGMQHCSSTGCAARSLVHRDVDACRNILYNALALARTQAPLPWMATGKHAGDPAKGAARRFYIQPNYR